MRAKVLVLTMVAALAVLAPALYIHFKPDAPAPAPQPEETAVTEAPAQPAATPSILKRTGQSTPQAALQTHAPSTQPAEMTHDEYVARRTAELNELGMHNDPESLKTILSELENTEPEIRQAALTATLDFGSKDAIPTLQNELNYATDPEEKIQLQKAIEFLQLPSLNEAQTASNN